MYTSTAHLHAPPSSLGGTHVRAPAHSLVVTASRPDGTVINSDSRFSDHVNPLNAAPEIYNPADPVSGMAAMPRNMTGMAMKMSAGGYKTHMFGKWDVSAIFTASL